MLVKDIIYSYNLLLDSPIDPFNTISRSIQEHYRNILNFFENRSTNASAESFNAKIKAFRSSFRGVKNVSFFLFRLANILFDKSIKAKKPVKSLISLAFDLIYKTLLVF